MQLFVGRAEAQGGARRLTVSRLMEPEWFAIAEICRQLDGIPLAIEMAAARVRTRSIKDIRSSLAHHFDLSGRTGLQRHQTLRALIDWSYEHLSDDEQVLMQQLSVFMGGWSIEAAVDICTGTGSIRDLVPSLVAKSLAVCEDWEGEVRYRMLETVRRYAAEKLVKNAASEWVRERHRDYFLALAEEAEPKLRGAAQAQWLGRLEAEHENLRLALDWSLSEEAKRHARRGSGRLQFGSAQY